jgi:hypothetical protein
MVRVYSAEPRKRLGLALEVVAGEPGKQGSAIPRAHAFLEISKHRVAATVELNRVNVMGGVVGAIGPSARDKVVSAHQEPINLSPSFQIQSFPQAIYASSISAQARVHGISLASKISALYERLESVPFSVV